MLIKKIIYFLTITKRILKVLTLKMEITFTIALSEKVQTKNLKPLVSWEVNIWEFNESTHTHRQTLKTKVINSDIFNQF